MSARRRARRRNRQPWEDVRDRELVLRYAFPQAARDFQRELRAAGARIAATLPAMLREAASSMRSAIAARAAAQKPRTLDEIAALFAASGPNEYGTRRLAPPHLRGRG